MKLSKLIIRCTCTALILTLAGCAKQNRYKPRDLHSLKDSFHIDYQETKENVTIRAKAFTESACIKTFGGRADRIDSGKNPLQPIQLCIENNSSSAWALIDKNIGLPLVPAKEVVNRLSSYDFKNAGIFCGVGLLAAALGATLFIVSLPALIAAAFCHAAALPAGIIFGYALVPAGGILMVASPFVFLIDNSGRKTENREISNCMRTASLDKAVVINPGKTVDLLLFVSKATPHDHFELTLIDEEENNKQLNFSVNLLQENPSAHQANNK